MFLFRGPQGKTTLAHIIANVVLGWVYGSLLVLLSNGQATLVAILTSLQDRDVLFIDEVQVEPSGGRSNILPWEALAD